MTTTTPTTDDSDSDARDYDWLLRNARELRIAEQRDQETESWERGRSEVGGLEDVDDQEPSSDGGQEPDIVETTQATDVATVDPSAREPATPSDPFAKELAGDVPERYVMKIHGDTYIRRAGFAAIARQAGLRPTVEPVVAADETDFEYARYRAEIRDENGNLLANEIGTSLLEEEDLDGAKCNLDELAATRAIRRALEWATGAGASLQEGKA